MEGDDEDIIFEKQMIEREKDVEAGLRSGNAVSALVCALSSPPFSSKNLVLKEKSATIVARALVAVCAKDEVFSQFLSILDADTTDSLMKYVVRLLSTASAHSALYLKVHGAIIEKAGLGCLVRCIVDRRAA